MEAPEPSEKFVQREQERHQTTSATSFCVYIYNFEQGSYVVSVFPLLTSSKQMSAGEMLWYQIVLTMDSHYLSINMSDFTVWFKFSKKFFSNISP